MSAAERVQVAGNRLLEIHRAGAIGFLYAAADDAIFLDVGIGAEAKIEDGGAVLATILITGSFCGNLVAPGLGEVVRQLQVEALQGFGFLGLEGGAGVTLPAAGAVAGG